MNGEAMARLESITDDLRREILNGDFNPGERLIELGLSSRYKVGRAVVREALLELAAEGLVDREANRGATVRKISIEEAIQITEARASLESIIARHAARHATPADHDELRDIEARMREAVRADANLDYSILNSVLHRRLIDLSRHAIAADLVTNLRNRAAHHQYRLSLMPGRPAESMEQHSQIIDAVVSGDEQAAAESMEVHLLSVINVLENWDDREL